MRYIKVEEINQCPLLLSLLHAYPKDGTIPREFENTVEVKAKPADNIDTIQEKRKHRKMGVC